MGDQRAISAFTRRAKLAGVLSCLAGMDPPSSAMRFLTKGSSSALSSAAASLAMISLGVPLGAKMPAPDIWIDGTHIPVTWDEPMPGVGRPWFECPACGQRCRHVYLRATTACGRCHGLQHAVRHLRRQTPGVGRVERLRRKLGGCDVRPFAPLPARRRGRSRAYHDKLVAQIRGVTATAGL